MLVKWEKIESNKIKLEIEVPSQEVETALSQAYQKVVKKVSLPGFRKGKVPRRILESRFSPQILHEEALDILLPYAYRQAIEEADLRPIDEPGIELLQMEEGKALLFNAVVEVMPEVELGQYRGLEVEQEAVEVSGEQVESNLENLRERQARLVAVNEGAAAGKGDLVIVDYQSFIDGKPVAGGEAENYSLELGSNSSVGDFEEQLIGAVAGERREFKISFPEDYHNKELAGKEIFFRITLKEIKRKELPDLNDDFAKEVSEFETLEELRADIRQRQEKAAAEQARRNLQNRLVRAASEGSVVEVPPVLVERQMDSIMAEMDQLLRYQGLNLEKLVSVAGKQIEELREEKREDAQRRAKEGLVLDAIMKKEGISVEDHELDEEIAGFAGRYNEEPARVKEIFEKQGNLQRIKDDIKVRKVLELLLAEARVTTVTPAPGTDPGGEGK